MTTPKKTHRKVAKRRNRVSAPCGETMTTRKKLDELLSKALSNMKARETEALAVRKAAQWGDIPWALIAHDAEPVLERLPEAFWYIRDHVTEVRKRNNCSRTVRSCSFVGTNPAEMESLVRYIEAEFHKLMRRNGGVSSCNTTMTTLCQCGQSFTPRRSDQLYCSAKCRKLAYEGTEAGFLRRSKYWKSKKGHAALQRYRKTGGSAANSRQYRYDIAWTFHPRMVALEEKIGAKKLTYERLFGDGDDQIPARADYRMFRFWFSKFHWSYNGGTQVSRDWLYQMLHPRFYSAPAVIDLGNGNRGEGSPL